VQQKESGLRYKSFLDFAGLDLQIFWNFYSKLKQNPREECLCAQTLLLRLLQSCFSVLQRDGPAASGGAKAPRQTPGGAGAAKELHTHLCDVVDRVDGDSVPMETLKQEVRNTLLNGAAVFFPDRQTRRSHLFAMMVIIHVRRTGSIPEVWWDGIHLLVSVFSDYLLSFSFPDVYLTLCMQSSV